MTPIKICKFEVGFKKNKEVLTEIIESKNEYLNNILAQFQSIRVEKNLSFFKYQEIINNYLNKTNNEKIKFFIEFKLNFFSKLKHDCKGFILSIDDPSSIIDKYISFISIVVMIASEPNVRNQVLEIFEKSIGAEVIEMPIILDGGNFVIIVPSNKNDPLSHSDGYLNFLTENRICLSEYPTIDFLKDDIEYMNQLKRIVIEKSLEITTIYDRPIAEKLIGSGRNEHDKTKECLNSARGIFINFLILNNTIILPEYSIPNYNSKMIYNEVNKHILQNLGYNVIPINCDELAKLGGSLHCISFTN
jgi:hypothetical protein